VAAVRDCGSGELRIYVDGVLDAEPVTDTITESLETNTSLIIGDMGYGSTGFFTGAIDDVKVYSRPLTDLEIDNLANQY
jgi:hypothetical protein